KDAELIIGDNVGISQTALLSYGSIRIGDNVKIGGGTSVFTTDFHSLDPMIRASSKRMRGVFNPFSLLNCFAKGDIADYWFASGTSEYLMRLMANEKMNICDFIGMDYEASKFVDYKATRQMPLPMLYQSGYLTIKGYDREFNTYRLDFPNEEVRSGMVSLLAADYYE
ncbi:MAG: hypothetical protein ACI378_04035, partial [Bacteroides sp.]